MNLDQKIRTIVEANRAATEFKPIRLKVRRGRQPDGTNKTVDVYVDQLPWVDLEPMIDRLNGAANAAIDAYNKHETLKVTRVKGDITPSVGGVTSALAEQGAISVEQIRALGESNRTDIETAESSVGVAFRAAFEHIKTLPTVAEDWVCACTGKDREWWHEKDENGRPLTMTQDFLTVLQVSLLVNYDGPVRDFSEGVLRRFLPKESANPGDTPTGAKPDLEVVAE